MSFTALLKTHDRIDRTPEFEGNLNPCKVHGNTPQIREIIAGKDKDSHFVAVCHSEKCNKITMESAEKVVEIWNKFNT